jgi:hypothetical protein
MGGIGGAVASFGIGVFDTLHFSFLWLSELLVSRLQSRLVRGPAWNSADGGGLEEVIILQVYSLCIR